MGKYLYQEIKDYLMKIIKENKDVANYQLPSENQLALKFQTTRITAKRALNELQEENYIYRIHGKGSFISPQAVSQKKLETSNFICMMLPNIDSRFISDLVSGAREYLQRFDYHLLMMCEKEEDLTHHNLISKITDMGIKGIIVFPNSRAHYNKDLLMLAFNKFPVVFVDRTLHNFDVSSVTSDHINMAHKGVQCLIDCGCQNIGFLTNPPENSSSIAKRITGYERCHIQNGRRILPENIFYLNKNDPEQSEKISDFLQEHKDIDGLLSYGGQIGYNVYRAIVKNHIQVPDQLKIIFFDDEYSQYSDLLPFSPSCISQRSFQIGQQAAKLILNYITKKTVAVDKILVDCDIIERQSTGGSL